MTEQAPDPILDPEADAVARAVQDTMALLAPHWGAKAKTWDELGADIEHGGAWCQHLLRSVVTQLIRDGVVTPVSRDGLAGLAREWDATAADIEQKADPDSPWWRKAYTQRQCAAQLRDRVGIS